MVRDEPLSNSTLLSFLVRLEEPGLSLRELATEVDYLRQDVQALKGMGNQRFQYLEQRRGDVKVRNGLKFEVSADRLRAVLRRLCDRLDDHPSKRWC
jgi:orotate phosphoribosyltransferase-like protein